MKDIISVIVPAYNVELYLKKCVESVINQTWPNIEIILVDDGSTDSTGEICDELGNIYKNIKVFHQDNAGLSVARNVGIDNCSGQWVAFLDSDDWVEPDMYATLHSLAVNNDVALSSCLSRDVIEGEINSFQGNGTVEILDYNDIIHGLQLGKSMRFEVWNKLWRRDLIADTRFIKGQVAEDVYFDRIVLDKARKIAHVNKVLHNYLVSRPGNTNSSFKVARLCIFNEFKEWKSKLEIDNKPSLACSISAIATNFAVDIYGNALRANQSKKILDELRHSFDLFFDSAIKAKMPLKRRIKFLLFRISPLTVKFYN